jgi:hypothetical protein
MIPGLTIDATDHGGGLVIVIVYPAGDASS